MDISNLDLETIRVIIEALGGIGVVLGFPHAWKLSKIVSVMIHAIEKNSKTYPQATYHQKRMIRAFSKEANVSATLHNKVQKLTRKVHNGT